MVFLFLSPIVVCIGWPNQLDPERVMSVISRSVENLGIEGIADRQLS